MCRHIFSSAISLILICTLPLASCQRHSHRDAARQAAERLQQQLDQQADLKGAKIYELLSATAVKQGHKYETTEYVAPPLRVADRGDSVLVSMGRNRVTLLRRPNQAGVWQGGLIGQKLQARFYAYRTDSLRGFDSIVVHALIDDGRLVMRFVPQS